MREKTPRSNNILVGLDNIQAFLGISTPTLQKLQLRGLPVVKIEGSFYATKTNLEMFFDDKTLIDPRIEPYMRK